MKHLKITIILFTILLYSCNNNSGENSTKKKVDLSTSFIVDSISKDIGVLRMFQLTDSIPLYKEKNNSSYFGTIKLDYKSPILHFYPQQLENYFNPLYFKYSGTDRESLETGKYFRDLTFRVLEKDDHWIKIVYNEQQNLTCYIKNIALLVPNVKEKYLLDHGFRTWIEYFTGKYAEVHNSNSNQVQGLIVDGINPIILNDSLPLYESLQGNLISNSKAPQTFGFFCDSIVNDWMRVIAINDKYGKYWVKWKDNQNKLLIKYEETWGQE